MKRIGKLLIGLLLLALFSVACSHYVCPAYSLEQADEQVEVERS